MLVVPSPNVHERPVIVPLPGVDVSANAQSSDVQLNVNAAVGGADEAATVIEVLSVSESPFESVTVSVTV